VRKGGPCLTIVAALAALGTAPIEARAQLGSLFSRSSPTAGPTAGGSAPPSATIAAPDGNIPRPPGSIPTPPPLNTSPLPLGSSAAIPPLGGPAPNVSAATAPSSGGVPTGVAALTVSARFGRDAPAITSGLHWRVYADKPDHTGAFRLFREDKSASPTLHLPPGGYVVHAAFGLATTVKRVTVRGEATREVFEIPAGGVRFEGRVADARIPAGQITFDVYKGGQFEAGDKRPIASEVPTGDLVLLPEGTYHVVSNYGDGNAVIRSDFRVQAGKLTDARINHRAARITLKLVGERGGEALANTAWSVLTPGGDVIKESIGAFPTVILAEGDYIAIARHEGKVFNREFKVEPGFDREIELLTR
jgi:hypothetical protein